MCRNLSFKGFVAILLLIQTASTTYGQQSPSAEPPPLSVQMARFEASLQDSMPPAPKSIPLYDGAIPNSIPGPDQEKTSEVFGNIQISNVSRPSVTVYLPPKKKATGAAILVFPGGAYMGLTWGFEGTATAQFLVSHGIAAIVVKYRMPNDATMPNKSIGPLQDAQQAIRLVRQHAAEWGIDPTKVGVMGFSAGGHLASTLGTHFAKSFISNDDHVNLRPDFMALVYPAVSMKPNMMPADFREILLGKSPSSELVNEFSNEEQVTDQTPPTLILHASNDIIVDVNHSLVFYEALHRHQVPAEMVLFAKGNHGFLEIPRDEWQQPLLCWLVKNGWGAL